MTWKVFPMYFSLYKRIKKEGLNKKDIASLLKSQQELKFMERRVELYHDYIRGQQLEKQHLEQEINRLQSKIKIMKENIIQNLMLPLKFHYSRCCNQNCNMNERLYYN
jgi:septal ring factor EnvC (AmiA/AmiB activator)